MHRKTIGYGNSFVSATPVKEIGHLLQRAPGAIQSRLAKLGSFHLKGRARLRGKSSTRCPTTEEVAAMWSQFVTTSGGVAFAAVANRDRIPEVTNRDLKFRKTRWPALPALVGNFWESRGAAAVNSQRREPLGNDRGPTRKPRQGRQYRQFSNDGRPVGAFGNRKALLLGSFPNRERRSKRVEDKSHRKVHAHQDQRVPAIRCPQRATWPDGEDLPDQPGTESQQPRTPPPLEGGTDAVGQRQ